MSTVDLVIELPAARLGPCDMGALTHCCGEPGAEHGEDLVVQDAGLDVHACGGEEGCTAVAARCGIDDADDDSGDAGVEEFLAAGGGDADVVTRFEGDDGSTT